MKIINTFMHGGRVLRPGDAVPDDVSDSTLQDWKRTGLAGERYDGPVRRVMPAPGGTKPAEPSRKQVKPLAEPKQTKPAAEPKQTKSEEPDAVAADASAASMAAASGAVAQEQQSTEPTDQATTKD